MATGRMASQPRSLGQTPEQAAQDRALRNHLHNLAIAIYQAQEGYRAAMAAGDTTRAGQWLQSAQALRDTFQDVAAQFTANNPYALGTFDRWFLATGTWISEAGAALAAGVGTVATIPRSILNEVVDTIGGTAQRAAWHGLAALIPVFLVAGAAIYLLREAEKSGTVRRVVKRYA